MQNATALNNFLYCLLLVHAKTKCFSCEAILDFITQVYRNQNEARVST